ncbi:MAG: proteasome-type protease [Betaproteobacteria bacterium]|nr:proteasome-type protease [Betaproteobacteria bacterium]
MTYCAALKLDAGLVFASDTRTSAGVDNASQFCKMKIFERPGDRVLVLLSAGNLAITQTTINLLEKHGRTDDGHPTVWSVSSLFDVAGLVGDAMREVKARDGAYLAQNNLEFNVSFLLGGQIAGEEPRLFNLYSEGNFIEATSETPFFQIGETKYGRPILDRIIRPQTSLADAAKCLLVSFDSTMRSNISVGPPIDILRYERDSLSAGHKWRFHKDDPYLVQIHRLWGEGLKKAFADLPEPPTL